MQLHDYLRGLLKIWKMRKITRLESLFIIILCSSFFLNSVIPLVCIACSSIVAQCSW
jgi:hypothetical protein